MHHFQLSERRTGPDSATIAVSGELDLASAPEMKRTVAGLMGSGVRHLEVDLAGATFVDSSGMGALLWASLRLHAAGGELAACCPTTAVARAFELAGLDSVLKLHGAAPASVH